MQSVDLVIIGAGPAGISTALHLLRQDPGWARRLLILERASHPRHKLCGGGVTRFGLQALRDLGLKLPLPLPQARVQDARLVYGERVVHVRRKPEFVVFQRAELDAYLADAARQWGAAILESTPVQSLSFDPEGVNIITPDGDYRAQAVVGADGSTGLTRRTMKETRPGRVARLLEVVTPAGPKDPQFNQQFALFDFTPVEAALQGYVWDFPSWVGGQPRHNRGVYDARVDRARARAPLPQLLEAALRAWEDDPTQAKVDGHPIHRFSPRNCFSRPRLLLVGDAAGVDPLFGEGIGPSLGYGQVAARAIQQAFQQEDFSFTRYRRQVLASPLGRYLLLRWAVAWWGYRLSGKSWFMHTVWTLGKVLAAVVPDGEDL